MWHSFIVIIALLKQEPGVNFVPFLLSVSKTGFGLTARVHLKAQKLPFQKKQNEYIFIAPQELMD